MTRRSLDWQNLNTAVEEAKQLHTQGYTSEGEWNLAQVLEHLGIIINASMDGFQFRLPRIASWIVKISGQKNKFFTTRRLSQGLPAPKSLQPNAATDHAQDEARAVEEFTAAVERFKQYTGPMQRSPVFGALDYDQWTEFHIIHSMHHFSFLTPCD